MAAGSNVYSANNLKASTTAGTETLALLPLTLAEYGSDANFCALFYIDEVKHFKDASGNDVLIAIVRYGSANYLMHAPARLGKGRLYRTDLPGIICNDGGLNTYGIGDVQHLTSLSGSSGSDATQEAYKPRPGDCKIFASIKCSYYAPCEVYAEYRKNGTTIFDSIKVGSYASKYTGTGECIIAAISERGMYDFRIRVENEEGTYYSVYKTLQVHARMFSAKFDENYASYANTSTVIYNVYIKGQEIETYQAAGAGTQLFLGENCVNLAPSGYYVVGSTWYYHAYNMLSDRIEVIRSGSIGAWPADDPARVPSVDDITVTGYAWDLVHEDVYTFTLKEFTVQIDNAAASQKVVSLDAKVKNVLSGTSALTGGTVTVNANSTAYANLQNREGIRFELESAEQIFIEVTYWIQGNTTNKRTTTIRLIEK